ncbi:MAG: hypothetical protein D6732_14160 [Methanobacteriota archaeon]|nr:MAG: hypothetical protein D6732_14160 [Euryarchaeota archaeon]
MLTIAIEKIRWKNIREIEDLEIKIQKKGVTLLQIQNGYGKTTTLTLLRCIVTGKLPPELGIPIDSFKYKGPEVVDDPDTGLFSVTFEINGSTYIFEIEFDYVLKEANFYTVSDVLGGRKEGWFPPNDFSTKFKDKLLLAKTFLFDGETSEEINSRSGFLLESLREITDLNLVYELIDDGPDKRSLQRLISDIAKNNGFKDATKKYQKLENSYIDLLNHINQVEDRKSEIENRLIVLDEAIGNKEQTINDIIGSDSEIKERVDEAKRLLIEQQKEIEQKTSELRLSLMNPEYAISKMDHLMHFYREIDRLKVPKIAGRSFFEELLNSRMCVCGREITEEERKYMKSRMNDYLADDIISVVRPMQDLVLNPPANLSPYSFIAEELEALLDEKMELENELAALQDRLSEDLQKKIQELQDEITRLKLEQDQLIDELEEITSNDAVQIKREGWDKGVIKKDNEFYTQKAKFTKCKNLFTLRKLKKHLRDEMNKVSNVHEFGTVVEIIQEVLSDAMDRTMEEIIDLVEKTLNTYYNTLVPHVHQTIRIRGSDNFELTFYNAKNEPLNSVHQASKLAAAYSFISAIFTVGRVQLPLVADSPVTSFSNNVAEEWGKTISKLFPQVIAFITSMEKGGLTGLIANSETMVATVKRENEDLEGKNASGKMICTFDRDLFKKYDVRRS